MPETRPVLIVGAGPTGLTAAMELSRFGVPVRLVDKAVGPATTSRALAVQARTVELMEQRGLAAEMLAKGNRGHATQFFHDGKPFARVDLGRIPSPFPFILLLPQSETERILRGQAGRQGVAVEFGTEMIAFAQGDERAGKGGVRAVLRRSDGGLEELDAAYLIAAEGAHSGVRRTLGVEFQGKSLHHTYALADLHLDGPLAEDEISIFLQNKGMTAVFPLGDRRFRLITTEPGGSPARADDPTVEEMQRLWDAGATVPARLRDMYWSSRFRINSRMVNHMRRDRIFFGGDSAHIHSPAGGQGMNTGIQDMINLGWKLALVYRGEAPAELLDTYEGERLPVVKRLLEATEGATDAATGDSAVLHVLAMLAMPAMLRLDAVQNRGSRTISQTGIRYSGCLTGGHGTLAGAPPGERFVAPDGHTPLHPSRFAVIGGLAQAERIRDGLKPCGDKVELRTDLPCPEPDDALALVRPDGHIALITRDPTEMTAWLNRWARAEPTA